QRVERALPVVRHRGDPEGLPEPGPRPGVDEPLHQRLGGAGGRRRGERLHPCQRRGAGPARRRHRGGVAHRGAERRPPGHGDRLHLLGHALRPGFRAVQRVAGFVVMNGEVATAPPAGSLTSARPAGRRPDRTDGWGLLALPVAAYLLVVLIAPLVILLARSVTDPDIGIDHYRTIFTGRVYTKVLLNTFV